MRKSRHASMTQLLAMLVALELELPWFMMKDGWAVGVFWCC